MNHIKFEWLRLRRKKAIDIIVLLGIVLSVVNIYSQHQKQLSSQGRLSTAHLVDAWTIEDYSLSIYYDVINPLINPDELYSEDHHDRLNLDVTPAHQRVLDAFETRKIISDFFYDGFTEGTFPGTSHSFIQLMVEAIEEDNLPLTAEDEANIEYALLLSKHLDTYQEKLDDEEARGAIDDLTQGGPLLYGWLPLLSLLILGILSHVEDLEQGRIVYRQTLPTHRLTYILSRFTSLLGLSLLYLVVILLTHLVWGLVFGGGLGDIWYPHRVIGQDVIIMSNRVFLARIWGLFLIRASFMIALGMTLAGLIRRQNLTVLLATYVYALLSLMTHYVSPLQHPWNPLYFNDRHDILGRRFNVFEIYRLVSHYDMPASPWRLVFFIVLIIGCLVILAYRDLDIRGGQSIQSNAWLLNRTPQSFYGLAFEWSKLGHLLSSRLLAGSLFVLVGFFVLLISFQDQDYIREIYSEEVFESNESMIDLSQASIDWIDSMDLNEQDAMIYASSYQMSEQRLAYYKQKQEDLFIRQESYQSGDGSQFYETFDQEINEHFYTGDLLSEFLIAGESPYLYSRYPSKFAYAVSLDRLEEIKNRGIRPIYQVHIMQTPYDTLKGPRENAFERLYYQDRDRSFLGLTYRLLHYYRFDLILLVIFVLVAGAGYTVEFQGGQHLDWLLTLPQSRQKILHEKLIAALIKMLSIVGIFLIILCVSGWLLGGWGQGELPLIRYLTYVENAQFTRDFAQDVYPSYEWVNLSLVILQGLSLIIMAGVFLISLAVFVSTFIKNYSIHLLIVFGIISGAWLAMVYTDFPIFIQWLPFSYLNIMPILSGEFLLNHPFNLSFGQGMWVLGLWSLVMIVLTKYRIDVRK